MRVYLHTYRENELCTINNRSVACLLRTMYSIDFLLIEFMSRSVGVLRTQRIPVITSTQFTLVACCVYVCISTVCNVMQSYAKLCTGIRDYAEVCKLY